MAQTATIVTTFDRLRNGATRSSKVTRKLGFAANFLYTLTGKRPDDVMRARSSTWRSRCMRTTN